MRFQKKPVQNDLLQSGRFQASLTPDIKYRSHVPSNNESEFLAVIVSKDTSSVPGRVLRIQFLLDGHGRNAVRRGSPRDLPLKIGVGDTRDREAIAEGVGNVSQMNLGRVEGVVLNRAVADGFQVSFAKSCERDFLRMGIRGCVRRLAVMAKEGHDVHVGRQREQTLLEQPRQVLLPGFHALGFGLINLADGHEMPRPRKSKMTRQDPLRAWREATYCLFRVAT